jgi:hypothetical protein
VRGSVCPVATDAGHFEETLCGVLVRELLVQFEEVDLITLATSGMAFELPPFVTLPHRERITSVLVEWTARTLLRVAAEAEAGKQRGQWKACLSGVYL